MHALSTCAWMYGSSSALGSSRGSAEYRRLPTSSMYVRMAPRTSSRRAVLVGRRHTSTTTGIFSRPPPTWGAEGTREVHVHRGGRRAEDEMPTRNHKRSQKRQPRWFVRGAVHPGGQFARSRVAGRPPRSAPAVTRDSTPPRAHVDHTDALTHPGEVSAAPPPPLSLCLAESPTLEPRAPALFLPRASGASSRRLSSRRLLRTFPDRARARHLPSRNRYGAGARIPRSGAHTRGRH